MEHFETEKIFHLEDIKFHPNINLIIGDEGVGKTSLLNYIGYKTEGFLNASLRMRKFCKIISLGTLDFDYKWLADENCPLGRRHVLFDALKFFFRGRLTEEEIKRICFIDNEQPKLSATLKLSLLSKSFYKIFYIIASIQNHIYAHDGRDKFTVLIDDLDAFLHPKWQQTVLTDLTKAFPNIQFIVTTHSPQVLSTVKKEQIRILGENVVSTPSTHSFGEDSSVLLAELMNVSPLPPLEIVEKRKEYQRLIEDREYESHRAKQLQKELIENYGENSEFIIQTEMLIRRFEALKKVGK